MAGSQVAVNLDCKQPASILLVAADNFLCTKHFKGHKMVLDFLQHV